MDSFGFFDLSFNTFILSEMWDEDNCVSSQARQELNPSQVTAYLRIKREPPEVEDTCISGDSSQDLHKQIIRNGS